ncbi:uncharacterized protein LOC133293176 isoform X2 [Gastrolobium bilobum]|uniref:uncharacterized protein LOC133293176 isoform X2 n=1 Tax=Gastrolobium bilobum TaxID=150636 RepID=UPI002AB31431|nr:uncharacterized protein LOC133293176 isoform X2 [Gastrolobium bilobum]
MARGRKKRQQKTVAIEPILNATEEAPMDANATHQETQASYFDANGDDARGSMTRSKMAKLGENAALGCSSGVRKKRGRKSKAEKEALKLLAMVENANANDEGNLEGDNANENDGIFNQKQRRGRKRGIVKDKEVVMVSGNKKGTKQSEDEARDENETESLSLNETETESQQKEEPLAVKVKDTSTGEIVTQKLQANQIWYLEKTEKVIVELNGNGQGMDSGSNLLVRFLGKLSQNSKVCPLSVERWNQMPEDNSLQQWNYIAENFEFDYAAGIKWVMSTLGERWKAHKYRLRRKYFYPNRSTEDILGNPPPGVDCADWTAFVNHYKDDKMRIRSLQNKLSRKKLKISHAGGSKSNARRGHEMELQLGRPVCRSEVILSTLKKKDGNYVNEEGKTLAVPSICFAN